ncbi:MAG: hypothetical protein IJO64_06755 [Clostridia bacterium]|nr:hypothetical protein [Clostridia bacterium]
MKPKKLIALLLLFCLAGSLLLASCETDDESSAPESVSGETSWVSEYQNQNGDYVATTSGKRYDGETITFLTCGEEPFYESEIVPNIETYENGAEQTYPQIINDDLKLRADDLEDKLGLKLEEIQYHSPVRKNGEMLQYIVQGNLSSTEDYQVVVPCLYDGATLALDGHLYNLLDLEGLQINAPWWNKDFNDSMTYADQLYFTIGDIGLVNKSCTQALFFNYDVWKKYDLTEEYGGNPYELVRNGKWTVDVVFEAAKLLSNDLNSDNKIDYSDEFGWSGQLDDMWSIFFGSGEKIASADADGYPMITMYNERSANVMEKLQDFVQGNGYYVSANDYFGVTKYPVELTREAFTTGRTLFFNDAVGTVAKLGVMEQHFGVVPEPKFDESQDGYHSLVNPWGASCFAIPVCVVGEKLQMTVDALNVLGASSKNTIAKDYQETVLSYMKTRDDESAEMINEYILPTRACDIGMVYQWGGLDILLQDMAKQPVGSFASNFEAKKTAAETALSETVDFYKENEK